jgi:hypothetical protein
MAYALRENKFGKIYGIDPWSTQSSAEGLDGVNKEWWSKIDHQAIYQGLVDKITEFGLNEQIVLIRDTSAHTNVIPNIDVLHIDGNHSEEASMLDALKWVPQVKKGGLIIFDDINWAVKASAWVDETCIKIAEIKGDNVWGIWVKPD